MAADKQISAASRRRTRLSGWVLSQFQVTLAICGMIVGFLVCFGLGFLSGVWFQTQEQMLPPGDAIALADDQLDRERIAPTSGGEMTFYSALTAPDGSPEPKLKPRSVATPKPERPSRSSETASPAAVVSRSPGSSPTVKPNAMMPDVDKPGRVASARAEPGRSSPLPVAAPVHVKSVSVKPPPLKAESQVAAPAPPKAKPEAPVTQAPQERFYSVQVGSFRKVDQAYRLQDQLVKKGYEARIGLSIVEGKGAWYRVRVGRYADRGSANKTAQRLQKREKIDVLVMRVSS